MVNVNNVTALKSEFEAMALGFNSFHDEMQEYLDGYEFNFYYSPKPNMPQNTKIGVNLVQMFADKLWFHTSELPRVNVPSTPEDGANADIREKIIYSVYDYNGMDLLWGDFAFDGGIMAMAVARTVFNVKKRCIEITRHDPRRCFYQKADSGDGAILVFWTATPMARSAIKMKYGVDVKGGEGMVYDLLADYGETPMDNEDYFLVVTRDDGETSCEFVGDQFLRRPYKHLQGGIPIDIAMPYKTATFSKIPKFYLSKIKDLQAEFNELWRRRANVVRKLGNPLVYGRGIYKNNEQEVKAQMATDGGFVALKENGELALLTIPETKMIDSALNDCFQRMKDSAGFPTATFGEVVGANTSGDALGMYFTPTQKMINHYNKSYKAFLQGINAKILRGYDKFGKIGEEFKLNGYMPFSSIRSLENGERSYKKGEGYALTFTKDVIAGNYVSVVTPASVTPKDDIAYKRFILDGVTNKFFSRQYGLDEIGVLSPEDEFKRLQSEQADPMLNPEGASAVAGFNPQARLEDSNGQDPFAPAGSPVKGVPTPEQIMGR